MQLHEVVVIDFLTKLFEEGHGYSSINCARSALSSFLSSNTGLTIGNFPSVIRFMKGIYELKPPVPKYTCIWDVNIVLNYLKLLGPNEDLTLFCLSHKLLMLLALTSGQRAQTLHKIDVRNINFGENGVIIPITELIKQSNPNKPNKFSLHLKPMVEYPEICVVQALKVYLNKTKCLRNSSSKLFISSVKPHNPISKDTVSRWLKTVLFEAGVETEIFTAHSTRAAKASKDYYNGLKVEEIMKQVGLSNNKTFQRHYNKVLIMESCG